MLSGLFQFSACCMVPLIGAECSACHQPAEIITEDQRAPSQPALMDLELVSIYNKRFTIVNFIEVDKHFEVVYYNHLSVSHRNITIQIKDVVRWASASHALPLVFIRKFTDIENHEDYEVLYETFPFGPSDEIGLPEEINGRRKRQFIKSVNAKMLEDYLCQLQPQPAE